MRSLTTLAHLRAIVLAGAVTLTAPSARAQQQPLLDVTRFAAQLGLVVVEPGLARRVSVGDAVTAAATEPALLRRIGVSGMHRGARVVIARVAADHVLVEVDELLPAPARASVKLAIGEDGALKMP